MSENISPLAKMFVRKLSRLLSKMSAYFYVLSSLTERESETERERVRDRERERVGGVESLEEECGSGSVGDKECRFQL